VFADVVGHVVRDQPSRVLGLRGACVVLPKVASETFRVDPEFVGESLRGDVGGCISHDSLSFVIGEGFRR